ncbi:hypothetical protein [uncultured Methanobrevibacter sp.]|uniref:hypothetical protein n=1 Tax=uncultured Methanobrevibacter sp. TaxID=253161 RepID=UPI00260094F4|nr:hypothetical protein [uncultured Methanobrevibacter sp.]
MKFKNEISEMVYPHYYDYNFKSVLQERANGLLKFIGIQYRLLSVMMSEFTTIGPGISRIDFAGGVQKKDKVITLILECQSKLPTDEDIKRFFQYVSLMRIFKNNDVELFILCIEKASYTKKEFIINDECTYTMHVISLKDYKAREIFKSIEDKLKNNEEITDMDIASLQVIVYTDYEESQLEILLKARKLIERIAESSGMDINDKKAIVYLLNVLSVNMLDEDENDKYQEETYMMLNPTDRYLLKKGKLDVARNLLAEGFPIEKVVKFTGLSKEDILKGK